MEYGMAEFEGTLEHRMYLLKRTKGGKKLIKSFHFQDGKTEYLKIKCLAQR